MRGGRRIKCRNFVHEGGELFAEVLEMPVPHRAAVLVFVAVVDEVEQIGQMGEGFPLGIGEGGLGRRFRGHGVGYLTTGGEGFLTKQRSVFEGIEVRCSARIRCQ